MPKNKEVKLEGEKNIGDLIKSGKIAVPKPGEAVRVTVPPRSNRARVRKYEGK